MLVKSVIKRFIKHPFSTSREMRRFFRDMKLYNSGNTRPEFKASIHNMFPILGDWDGEAGVLSYYFWQDLWAAKKVFRECPSEHYDIASRVDGFIAYVMMFMPVTMIDISPLPYKVDGLKFI